MHLADFFLPLRQKKEIHVNKVNNDDCTFIHRRNDSERADGRLAIGEAAGEEAGPGPAEGNAQGLHALRDGRFRPP